MEETLRWLGFAAGVVFSAGTVVGVMKTFIVPRRSWSLIPALVGRTGFRVFHWVARRMPSYDLADRFLGFLAPVVIIGILAAFLASFVIGFALLLLPWADLTLGDALRESGSSVFTLGFLSTREPAPLAIDVFGAATGMIFVALTIGYLPALYSEVKRREALVKQLEGWTGTPSWGPEILARFTLAAAVERLPALYTAWDQWAAQVADSHMKYPALTHFRLPRAGSHWLTSLLAVMDAAALDLVLRPGPDRAEARLLLNQGLSCLRAVAYPMRRVDLSRQMVGIDEHEFRAGLDRVVASGFPVTRSDCAADPEPRLGGAEPGPEDDRPVISWEDRAWQEFAAVRSTYAPVAYQLTYWTIAAPAPWSGPRAGFADLDRWPPAPQSWSPG